MPYNISSCLSSVSVNLCSQQKKPSSFSSSLTPQTHWLYSTVPTAWRSKWRFHPFPSSGVRIWLVQAWVSVCGEFVLVISESLISNPVSPQTETQAVLGLELIVCLPEFLFLALFNAAWTFVVLGIWAHRSGHDISILGEMNFNWIRNRAGTPGWTGVDCCLMR